MDLREGFLVSQRNLAANSVIPGAGLPSGVNVRSLNQEMQTLFQQANTYFQLGQTQKMIDLCDEGLRKYPGSKELHFNRGYGYWKMGQPEVAMSSYRKAVELDPDFAPALNNMGLVYLKANDVENALKMFQKATTGRPPTEDAWLNYAIALTRKNEKRQALGVLQAMSEKFPSSRQAFLYRGHIHREFREIQDAVNAYTRVLQLDPNNRDALLSLAVISADVGRKQEALDHYRRLTDLYPNDAEVWKMYGYTLRQFRETDKSVTAFRTALSIEPNCVQTMIEQANNHLDRGEAEAALALYDRILKVDPDQKDSLILKASILADLSNDRNADPTHRSVLDAKKREALGCLDRAIAIDGGSSDAYLLKGLIQKSMGENESAVSNLGQAVARNDACPIGHMARAALFFRLGQRSSAKDELERLSVVVTRTAAQPGAQASPQDEAFKQFLGYYIDSENSLKNYSRSKQDLNRFGGVQSRNLQKVLFLHAQNFERKTKEDYDLFAETMRRVSEVDTRNFKLASAVMPPNTGTTPLEQYRTAFFCYSEIIFEHFRDVFLTVEDPLDPTLAKPLSFIDLPTYAQALALKFDRSNGAVLDSAVQDKALPIYSFFRDHSAISNPAEETRRYLMFFTGRNPSEVADFTMVHFQQLLGVILSSRDHQARIERAGSHPDALDFKRSNILNKIDDPNHQDYFGEIRSEFQVLGLHDALLVRSLMVFYRHKSELQYATSLYDEVAKFLLDRNYLFSRSFPFDKVGGTIVTPIGALGADAHALERPIMAIDTDPDRILNYVEIRRIKFILYKKYSVFGENEIAVTFRDFPNKPLIYKQPNHSEMLLSGFVFPQRKRTTIEMNIVINREHRRSAILQFHNLLEDEVWVSTEIFKVSPSREPKNFVKLYLVKKGL